MSADTAKYPLGGREIVLCWEPLLYESRVYDFLDDLGTSDV